MSDCGYFSLDYCNDECQKQFQFHVCRQTSSDYCCVDATVNKVFLIVGVVVAVLAVLGIIGGVLGCYFCRRCVKRYQNSQRFAIGDQIQQSCKQPTQQPNDNMQPQFQEQTLQSAIM
ncbi:Hypothetical_protein [Hexamita inflata]|uniref:Hypothetical_protein n=1 Tax=Hexamita inflata TaxID=28002 RepID=A0AA86PSW1_9EUKA|nr:Hypothetical protein HINF_LOCUS33350 [Hexamita inflata]CAI9973738.1 Hypothetical protein HINF_LOCUS61383 [Hexamita inflata]